MDLKPYINRQISKNKNLNLLFGSLQSEIEIDNEFYHRLIAVKQSGLAETELNQLIEHAVQKTLHTLYQINQFIQIPDRDIEKLRNIYRTTWYELTPETFETALFDHHQKLANWIEPFYPATFKQALRQTPRIGRVVNTEYSARLQLKLFGLTIDELPEPVIDVGCGPHANLVTILRKAGKQAVGIDREIALSSEHRIQSDWFKFEFAARTWGTIIAHMSFSNHLLYVYQHEKEKLPDYLFQYHDMLGALKPNGLFLYAPSLPFIEERLSAFDIERKEICNGISITIIRNKIPHLY